MFVWLAIPSADSADQVLELNALKFKGILTFYLDFIVYIWDLQLGQLWSSTVSRAA
jgi:hypothetical protein